MVRGILVAGGSGRRLGASKARVAIAGVTLLQRALDAISAVAGEIVVAAPERMNLRLPDSPRARRVFDRAEGKGPLAGIVAALEDRAFDVAVVLGIDFPLMRAATLEAIVARLGVAPDVEAVVPAPGGRLQPLAAAYRREFTSRLVAAFESGERSIVKAVERLAPTVLSDEEIAALEGGAEAFFNLNTPEDLTEAARRIAASTLQP
ncbi:MAG TPA: molybdenum cofactor guanylyltransferase [Candidatus Eisenbacteria bacterium]|nr:molybdenum cofactor guanylyltransferase [Candidatus Eisenbacteria bacterium]